MRRLFYFIALLLFFSSCGLLNQNIMFRTGADYKYDQTPDYKKVAEYRISANDVFTFEIYSNDGFNLINLTNFTSGTTPTIAIPSEYLVDADGQAKLPIIGKKQLAGLTLREAEIMLEENYSSYYLKPFVVVKILKRKVIYFPGNWGDAMIIELDNNNTTLIRLIAKQGGLTSNAKARLVKLIRYVDGVAQVYKIDLSRIEGINDANIVLQANDIVYVEPRRRISSKALTEMAPIISLFTTTMLTIAVIAQLKK